MVFVGLLIVFILALVALTRISKLERDVARLSALLANAVPPQVIAPIAETAPAPQAAAVAEPAVVEPEVLPSPYAEIIVESEPPPPRRDVEQAVASRWFVWVGGVAIAIGGVLFVKYAVDKDLLSPAVRCAIGLIFGLFLIAGGEFLRRRTVARQTYVPAAVTAAGLVIAFGSIYAAHSFYDLIAPTTAFAGLALTGLGAFALSLAQGPLIAALGLLGSYATPAIIPSVEPSAFAFFPYLFIILAASFAVARQRPGWWWLSIAAILGALAWAMLWLMSDLYAAADRLPIGLFALALIAVPILASLARNVRQSLQFATFLGGVAGFLVLTVLVVRNDHAPGSLVFLAVAAAIMFAAATREKFDFLAPEAIAFCLIALAAWSARDFAMPAYDEFGSYVLVLGPETGRFLRWMGGFAAAFILACYIAMWLRPHPVLWATSGVATVLVFGFVAFARASDALTDNHWMMIAGSLAALHLLGTLVGRRRVADPRFNTALGLYAIAATALAAFAAAMIYQGLWLTLAWSLLVPIVAFVALAMPLRLLGAIASVVAAVVTLRLFAAHELWFGGSGLWLNSQFILYAFGGPAAVFWTSSWLFSRSGHPKAGIALEGAALGLAIALISLELRVLIGGGIRVDDPGLLEISAHALAWLGATIGLLYRQKRVPSPVPLVGSRILLVAASLVLLFGCLGVLNPLVTQKPLEGSLFFNTLSLAYLLPAILIAFISQRLERIGWSSLQPFFGGFSLLLALAYLTLETKRFFHGPILAPEALSDAENYAYSAVWLAFAVALLIAGIWRGQRYWRYAGLIVAALVVVKVFLLDMSGLAGLYRIASFIGLGLCLVGIGYLYARFVQPLDATQGTAINSK